MRREKEGRGLSLLFSGASASKEAARIRPRRNPVSPHYPCFFHHRIALCHCERSEAISNRGVMGLLRFARNDIGRAQSETDIALNTPTLWEMNHKNEQGAEKGVSPPGSSAEALRRRLSSQPVVTRRNPPQYLRPTDNAQSGRSRSCRPQPWMSRRSAARSSCPPASHSLAQAGNSLCRNSSGARR